METPLLLLCIGCLACETSMAAAVPKSSNSMLESFWKNWVVSDYEPNYHSSKKVEKSIFHFPTFRPDCGDGYEANESGKCVKIIIIEQDEQDKINLYVLNTRFAYILEDISEEISTNSDSMAERFDIDIPILEDDDDESPDTLEREMFISNNPPTDNIENELPALGNTTPLNPDANNNPTITTTPEYLKMRFKNNSRKNRKLHERKHTKRPIRPNELNYEDKF